MTDKNLKCVYHNSDNEALFEYKPTLFALFYQFLDQFPLRRRIRYYYELLRGGYRVYYYAVKDEIIGQCVVIPGGRKVEGTTGSDITIGGPYYILPKYRGKGFGVKMVRLVLEHCSYKYDHVCAYISRGNTRSIALVKSLGLTKVGEGYITKIMHCFRMANRENDRRNFELYRL